MTNRFEQFRVTDEDEPDNRFAQFRPSFMDSVSETGQEAGRQLGLTARHALAGPAKAATGINDAFLMAGNQIAKWMGMEGEGLPMTTPMIDRALDEAGLPKTQNATERVVQIASEYIAGTGPMIQAGKAAPILEGLAANPTGQAVGSAAAGAATQIAEESGVTNPLVKTGIGLAAGVLPGWLNAGGQAAVRGATRGSSPTPMAENIAPFEQIGGPTVGQVVKTNKTNALENRLKDQPSYQEKVGQQEQMAQEIVGGGTPTTAGRVVERGVKGPDGFINRFKENSDVLYNKVDQYFDPDTPMEFKNTWDFFQQPSAFTKNMPRTASKLSSDYLKDLGVSLKGDLVDYINNIGDIGLPYQAMKEFRTAVGKRLESPNLIDDVSKGELKQLYAVLSKDLETAAGQLGGDAGFNAARRATNYYRAGRDRTDVLQKVVNKAGGPEKIYKGLESGTKDGATVYRQVMRSIDPADRKLVAETMISRLGKGTKAGGSDSRFDFNQFRNNWKALSPEARLELSRSIGPNAEDSIGRLVRAGDLMAQGKGASSAFPDMAKVLTDYDYFSRLLTSPKAIDFLLQSTTAPPEQAGIMIQEMIQQMEDFE